MVSYTGIPPNVHILCPNPNYFGLDSFEFVASDGIRRQ